MPLENKSAQQEEEVYFQITINFYGLFESKPVFSMNMEVPELLNELPLFIEKESWSGSPLPTYCKAKIIVTKHENVYQNRKRHSRYIEEIFRYKSHFFGTR